METLWIILGVLLLLIGFMGSLLPFIPGPPLAYAALLLHHVTAGYPYSTRFLVLWAILTAVVELLENIIPVLGTERFGRTRYGVGGCIIGLILGIIFFPPFGILVGPLIGAFIGEIISGQSSDRAFQSAVGAFIGFLVSTLIKVIAVAMMGYYYFTSVF